MSSAVEDRSAVVQAARLHEPQARRLHHENQRPSPGRRARRGVLFALMTFAVLQLGTAIALESGPDRDPIYSVRLRRLRQQQHDGGGEPLTIVMLGTSRTECGLRSAELRQQLTVALGRPVAVGNFGLSGCSYPTHLLVWNRLVHDGVRPDLVLIEAMPAMLNESWLGYDLTEERLPLARIRACDLEVIERNFPDARPGLRRAWCLAWPNPLYHQRLTLVSRFAPSLLPWNQRWWKNRLPEDEPIASTDLSPQRRQQALQHTHTEYADNLRTARLGGEGYRCLRELLARVRGDGVAAALVLMPEGPAFQSWYAPGAYHAVRDGLDDLAKEFGVAVLDLHDGMAESDFYDSHHLTPASAARFTEQLGTEHLLPLLNKQSASTAVGQ